MPREYSREAIKDCFDLYLKYNGAHFDLIEKDMRGRGYANWSRQNLVSKGKGDKARLGWIEKFNWEQALKIHLASMPMAALNSAQLLVQEIEIVRQRIFEEIKVLGAKVGGETNKDLIYQHRDYCKLSIEALQKVEAARDTLGGFVNFWERLLEMLNRRGCEKAERELLKVSEVVIEEARKELGEEQDGLRPATSGAVPAAAVEGSGLDRSKD